MKKIKIAIDASRNKSGGAKIHLIEILNNFKFENYDIKEVHLWSYKDLLNEISDYPWLKKHLAFKDSLNIFSQLYWQNKILPKLLRKEKIDILLNTSAGSVCYFKPNITMSREMLSFEKGEMEKTGFSLYRLRILILRYVQIYSFKKANGVIFLTNYASRIIQNFTGRLDNFKIINHGISNKFRKCKKSKTNKTKKIKCIYVSNVDFYKNQWNVVKAFSDFKNDNMELYLVGSLGDGKAKKLLEKTLLDIDPEKKFIKTLDHVNHNDLPTLLSSVDIFIFASSCENMPNTLVEGMASGLPILCSNRGPMPEILQDGGIYFDPENAESISKALQKMIKNEKTRLKFSKKSLYLSQKFSWEKCSKQTFEYLIEIYKKGAC